MRTVLVFFSLCFFWIQGFANEVLSPPLNNYGLVIANEWYAEDALVGAGKDGGAVASALSSKGYKVKLLKNVTKDEILEEIKNISVLSKNATIDNLVLFYTGHGVESRTKEFFWIPIESSPAGVTEKTLREDGVSLTYVNNLLVKQNITNIFVFSDAFRILPSVNDLEKVESHKFVIQGNLKERILLNSFSSSSLSTADTDVSINKDGSAYVKSFIKNFLDNSVMPVFLNNLNKDVRNSMKNSQVPKHVQISKNPYFNRYQLYDSSSFKKEAVVSYDGMSKWKKK